MREVGDGGAAKPWPDGGVQQTDAERLGARLLGPAGGAKGEETREWRNPVTHRRLCVLASCGRGGTGP